MAIKNYTTSINVMKTIGEIQALLAKAGASAVMCEYNNGLPSSVAFKIETPNGIISYQLPARIEKVYFCLCESPDVPKKLRSMEQAGRVGWRIVKDWISAQLAFIESDMVTIGQVFLPYAQNPKTGQTVFEMMEENKTLLLKQ